MHDSLDCPLVLFIGILGTQWTVSYVDIHSMPSAPIHGCRLLLQSSTWLTHRSEDTPKYTWWTAWGLKYCEAAANNGTRLGVFFAMLLADRVPLARDGVTPLVRV